MSCWDISVEYIDVNLFGSSVEWKHYHVIAFAPKPPADNSQFSYWTMNNCTRFELQSIYLQEKNKDRPITLSDEICIFTWYLFRPKWSFPQKVHDSIVKNVVKKAGTCGHRILFIPWKKENTENIISLFRNDHSCPLFV